MDPYLRDILDVSLRLLHVLAGIAWIGASLYFVRLDLALRPPKRAEDAQAGVAGEFWGVHGGGLYQSRKYRLAPAELPEPLHWFKWEAYTTWLTGFALLVVLYYADADVRLAGDDVGAAAAVGLSVGGLVLAWAAYDVLCRTVGRRSQAALAAVGVVLLALVAWLAGELFAPRAAYLQVGSMLGTIMAANVLLAIIPAHRKLVRALAAGEEPDPAPLLEAKRRSVHNNYLTLPVLFTMLAGHAAFTFGHEHAWLVLVAIALLTAWLRHFFNLRHAGRRAWWVLASGALAAAALALWLRPEPAAASAGPVPSERVRTIVADRCATSHSGRAARAGSSLATRAEIAARVDDIEREALR